MCKSILFLHYSQLIILNMEYSYAITVKISMHQISISLFRSVDRYSQWFQRVRYKSLMSKTNVILQYLLLVLFITSSHYLLNFSMCFMYFRSLMMINSNFYATRTVHNHAGRNGATSLNFSMQNFCN